MKNLLKLFLALLAFITFANFNAHAETKKFNMAELIENNKPIGSIVS